MIVNEPLGPPQTNSCTRPDSGISSSQDRMLVRQLQHRWSGYKTDSRGLFRKPTRLFVQAVLPRSAFSQLLLSEFQLERSSQTGSGY